MSLNPQSKSFVFFTKMVDELVEHAIKEDHDLLEGIQWLDAKCTKEGITFYQIVFRTLYKHDLVSRAKEWRTVIQSDQSVSEERKP